MMQSLEINIILIVYSRILMKTYDIRKIVE